MSSNDKSDLTPRVDKTPTTLHIMPGLHCNLACSHCVNNSGPKQTLRLTEEEIEKIGSAINELKPDILQFTGGEPTLHIDLINRIIESCPTPDSVKVHITSNGWYAESEESIDRVLSKLKKLTHLQLSFDMFHRSGLSRESVECLQGYCQRNHIGFNISICLTEPMDLIHAQKKLKNIAASTVYQKVDAVGRAKTNSKAYAYPSFDRDVLKRKCPNLGVLTYIAGRGFTTCCSNLVFNWPSYPSAHKSHDEHLSSEFFKQLSDKNMGETMVTKGLTESDLLPEHSSTCRLCELLHTGK